MRVCVYLVAVTKIINKSLTVEKQGRVLSVKDEDQGDALKACNI